MLGVIAELDDIEVVVVALDEMRLGAAAHLADQAARMDGHGGSTKASF